MVTEEPEATTVSLFSSVTFYLFAVTVLTLVYFIYTRFREDETWEKYGVKHANMGFRHFRAALARLLEEHGDTVGVNRGRLMLVTRDLDLLKQIMVKDFNNFVDRTTPLYTNSLVAKGLFFLEGDDWRRIRQLMSPSFSTGKLKHMSYTVNETARKLTKVMEECARKGLMVQIKHSAGQYTSEIIARTAFGLHTDCLGGEDDEFTRYAKTIFKTRNAVMSKIMLFFFIFPWVHKFVVQTLKIGLFDSVSEDADLYLNAVLHKSISERQVYEMNGETKKKPNDFLQSLVSAKAAGDRAAANPVIAAESVDNGGDVNCNHTADANTSHAHVNSNNNNERAKTMTSEELIGQSMLVIFAAFETTSTALQMCLFLLAKHPDVQEKVYNEIMNTVSSETPSPDELGQLKYMEQVINETLRMYPPAFIVTRKAAEKRTYGTITIPKDAGVMIPIYLILHDPKTYPDPEKFDPERFSDENKAKRDPIAFIPFGYGPRQCIGMRLAYQELKIALVHITRKLSFELNENTVPKRGGELKFKQEGILIVEDPIQLAVQLRGL